LFKSNPEKYIAMIYQTNMVTDRWPANQCQYVLVHRKGTTNYAPKNVSPDGNQTILMFEYERLSPFPGNVLPKQYRDKWTDTMTFQGQMVHTEYRLPIMPGRGMGVCDEPNLKIIGDVDPSDIHQGAVGNCWLLSGISALAEFDGAIKKIFRKTKKLDQRPFNEPNMYTLTLWDLATWKEVGMLISRFFRVLPQLFVKAEHDILYKLSCVMSLLSQTIKLTNVCARLHLVVGSYNYSRVNPAKMGNCGFAIWRRPWRYIAEDGIKLQADNVPTLGRS